MRFHQIAQIIAHTGAYFTLRNTPPFSCAFPQNNGVHRFIPTKDKTPKGDPIDVLSGQVVEQRTDFILGQTIPLSFTRTWARSKETDFADGLCGRYWADNFSEYVKVSANGQHIQIATLEGTYLRFALPLGYMQSFNPDHPQFTLNRHRDYLELFDRETRLSKFFQISTARFAENKDELGFPPLEDGIFPINHWQDEFANRVDFIYQDNRLAQVKHSDGIELALAYQGQWLHQIIRTDTAQSEILVTYHQDEQGALVESNALLDFHLFYDYDDKFNLIRWSDRDKTWVDYHYDEQGRVIHSIGADGFYPVWFQYEENRTTVLDSQQRATVYDYDNHLMKPLTITSPSGAKTHFDYDRYGNLLTQTLPDGNQIRFDYLEQTGLVRCFTDTLGNQWQYEYDDREELIKLTDPLNRTWVRQTHLAENGEKQTALFTAPDGTTTEFVRNQFGLLTEVKSTVGQRQQLEQFHYDPRHRLIETQDSEQRRIQLGYDDKDRLSRFTNGRGYQWQYGYNAQHKLSRINRPNQSLEQQDYDRHGNLIRYTDANGVDWQLEYGAFDLLTEKIDGEGNRWQYDYDKDSLKLNKVTNPKGEIYTYTFNENGQVATETDFADNYWVYTYNENGTLKSLTDGEGNVTHYDYDPGYRLIRLITTDDSYFYDYDKLGRVTAIQSLYSRQTFDYDLNDRIIKETQNGNRIDRTYDDENQTLTRTLYVEGKDEPIITQFKYNNLGELIELNLPNTNAQPHQLFFQYDQNGNETDRTSPQGFILKQTYDAMDCLTQQRAGWEPTQFFDKDELRATGIDEPSFAEVNQRYRYDKALNTLETKDKGEQLYFTLNKNNQITAVHNPNREQERYAYDECGYLTQRYVGSETYGLIQNPHHPEFQAQRQIVQHQDIYQKGHKLYRLNENYYEYDKAGRLVTKVEKRDGFRKQETHYRWNGKNELIGITTPKGKVWHYKYDALGRRIAKECPQQHLRIEYLWDGDQLAYTQTFKNGKLDSERHSIFNGWQLIAQQDRYQQLKQTIDGNFIEWKFETNYAIVQPNGKVLGLLAPNGKLSWRAQNKSLWGLTFSDYNRNSPLDPNLLFAGQYYDEESGLAYNRFRYYDPNSACYLNSDPIGLEGGSTPYFYVQNPLDWVDLFGLAGCKPKISVEQYQAYKKLRNLGLSAKEATKYSKGFDSFSQFKRVVGPAGKGQAWHHIVEQTPSNIAKFGANKIHNINNLIKVPHGKGTIHSQISGFYSSKAPFTQGKTVRQWLSSQTFSEQFEFGIEQLQRLGWNF
ncbi:RHS repeat-associated core domain-containing protein [Avibacterium endocarditidis]|uniref:RHS repeat-associated core domain-containing protein n=1 Tax=Avibacterium TaxID=292486 RepID=UPI0039FCA5A5